MKRLFVLVCALGLWAAAWAAPEVNIVPKPLNVETGDGSFTVDAATVVTVGRDASLRSVGELFAAMIEPVTGRAVKVKTAADGAKIDLAVDPELGEEEYVLRVTPAGADVRGGSPKGVLYGLQSLRQLVIEGEGTVPAVTVKDKPYFGYRGAMLDVCRHFMPVEDVKAFIDILAMHKLNRFHFHLTDDQGWRIKIKKYPDLARKGSVRKETLVGNLRTSTEYDGIPYGGYYTQKQIREIVRYAAERHIEVIPEIEMPGHGLGALTAYPWLGCRGENYEVWTRWGISKDVFCAGKDSTFEFLQDVLAEVIELFPSKYIHIGGDEADRTAWKSCPRCRHLARELGGVDQVQCYLVEHAEKFLAEHGQRPEKRGGVAELLHAADRKVAERPRPQHHRLGRDLAGRNLENGHRDVVARFEGRNRRSQGGQHGHHGAQHPLLSGLSSDAAAGVRAAGTGEVPTHAAGLCARSLRTTDSRRT